MVFKVIVIVEDFISFAYVKICGFRLGESNKIYLFVYFASVSSELNAIVYNYYTLKQTKSLIILKELRFLIKGTFY